MHKHIRRAVVAGLLLAGATLATPSAAGAMSEGDEHPGGCIEVVAAKARTGGGDPPAEEPTTTVVEEPTTTVVEEPTTTVAEEPTTTTTEEEPDPCEPVEVTPAAPDFAGECGAGTVEVADTAGVAYTLDGDPLAEGEVVDLDQGEHTVTATAEDGYAIADGAEVEWAYTVTAADDPACAPDLVEVDPVAPTLGEDCPAILVIPEVEGVVYKVEGIDEPLVPGEYVLDNGSEYVIVASPAEGYTFPEGAETSFPVTGTPADECPPSTSVPTGPTLPEPPAPTTTVAEPISDDELPQTGSNSTGPMVAAGLGLLVLGAALVVGKRKLSA